MAMNTKERNNKLMQLADKAICETRAIFKENTTEIQDSYNGQIAALGVSIAMSGLLPALAIYYQDSDSRKVNRRAILTIIARMIKDDNVERDLDNATDEDFADETTFFKYALRLLNQNGLTKLQREVIDCAIALKQVVRTYNLVKS